MGRAAAGRFSGILTACAFIPVDWGGCVWIGFLPLLTALWYGRRREGKRGMLAYALYGWMFGVVFYGISFWWVNEVSTLGYIPLMIFTEACFPASGLWSWECSSDRTPGRCPMRG